MKNALAIKSIEVEKLFGYFDYKIPNKKLADISRILILYGNNGSGKTTLLRILFWLLSSRNRSGYKSRLSRTKFQSVSILFENGVEIAARRRKGQIVGSFRYTVRKNKKVIHSLLLKVKEDNSIDLTPGSPDDEKFLKILKFLRDLNISVFYLSDDRRIFDSRTSSANEEGEDTDVFRYVDDAHGTVRRVSNSTRSARSQRNIGRQQFALDPVFQRLSNWIKTQTIFGSRIGEKNSNAIYADLIKKVAKPADAKKGIISRKELLTEVTELENNIAPFVQLGLIEPFDGEDIKRSITARRNDDHFKYISDIVSPFLDALKAKLSAFDALQKTLNLFLDSVNDYFSHKRLGFEVSQGFSLQQQNGEALGFDDLSSGEKQLLLLFSNIITAADKASIFLIDEPEISLNIKWQRKFVDTLLRFSANKNIQFVLASHSIELLSTNLGCVTELASKNDGI